MWEDRGRQEGESIGGDKKAREIALEILKNHHFIDMVTACTKLSRIDVFRIMTVLT